MLYYRLKDNHPLTYWAMPCHGAPRHRVLFPLWGTDADGVPRLKAIDFITEIYFGMFPYRFYNVWIHIFHCFLLKPDASSLCSAL